MAWLKRNWLLAVSGLIALGLLGFAGYFLYSKVEQEATVSDQLAAQTKDLEDLANLNPNPGNEKINNIEAAKKQNRELLQFVAVARKDFVPLSYPENLDSGQFKLLLDNTIDELTRSAKQVGVKLPDGFNFTFSAQKPQMAFEPANIAPMARALTDIKAICEVLFQARVLTVDNIRRIQIATLDTPSPIPGQSEYWTKKAETNNLAIVTPYEFTFHCFNQELAVVLETLYRSPHAFVVKNMVVDTGASPLLEKPAEGTTPGMPPPMNAMQMMMMMRYSPYSRYYTPQPMVAPRPTGPGGLTLMLDEKPFRVIMWVDVITLLPENQPRKR